MICFKKLAYLYTVSKRPAYALLYIGVGRCLHYFVRTGRELVSVWEGSLSLHAIMLLEAVLDLSCDDLG